MRGPNSRKVFQSAVLSDAEDCVLPSLAVYVIDRAAAREILELAHLVRQRDLHQLEKLDRRVAYYREGGEVLRVDDEEPTGHERLIVAADTFCFAARLQDACIEVRTQSVPMNELAHAFSLDTALNETTELYATASPSP